MQSGDKISPQLSLLWHCFGTDSQIRSGFYDPKEEWRVGLGRIPLPEMQIGL